MKINWGIIKFLSLIAIIAFLFSFTNERNSARNLSKIDIKFTDINDPFITLETVNKLLIQNQDSVTGIVKERLVLKEAETRLLANKMIRDAEVYVSVDGVLGAKIEQRNPIARIVASVDYYLDEDGTKMPLSSVYTARVPIVTGLESIEESEITKLILKIREDQFLSESVIGLDVSKEGIISLRIRKHTFKVLFGKAEDIDRKFMNYKAFYQKTKNDNTLGEYMTVDLQFGNQVVATKR